MKKGLKRKYDEPISIWILRAAEKTNMTQEQTELLISVYRAAWEEGMLIGEECERINNVKKQPTMKQTSDEFFQEGKTETQKNNILAHLKEGKTITPLEALNLYGCFRLAAIIFILRNDLGLNIVTERIKTKKGKYVAQYRLVV